MRAQEARKPSEVNQKCKWPADVTKLFEAQGLLRCSRHLPACESAKECASVASYGGLGAWRRICLKP